MQGGREVQVDELTTHPRRLKWLTRDETLVLLGTVSLGRLVFTVAGLPTVRPVNHIVDDGAIVFRTHLGSANSLAAGAVVAYEADQIDPEAHVGWSAIVTGVASLVEDLAQVEAYERRLRPWVAQQITHVIRISTDVVTGVELV